MVSTKDLLGIACRAARDAAEYLQSVSRPLDPTAWGTKGPSDFVTEVDRTAERMIAEILRASTPEAAILGEELSPEALSAPLTWVVDPLDGTTNFLHGYPAYAVSIAAVQDGQVAAGVVLDVVRDLLYHAQAGEGAWLDGNRLTTSAIARPEHALIGTGFPFKHRDRLEQYLVQFADILTASGGIRRAGSAALDLADVARGSLDGFWELALAPWDIAAGALLIREAGGHITDLRGSDIAVAHTAVVAGNPAIHPWLLDRLAQAAHHLPST
ncbi:MAG TPA: inositol monophosphatase family protein [Gemmatimonadales bacterium]|nr:inositol monophosphatase family protein [Gemmatimonadales bacterium]